MSHDPTALKAQFPILAGGDGAAPVHFLDNAAGTQVPTAVLDAVRSFETGARANVARGVHRLAEAATQAYEDARATVAGYLGAVADEVVFTSGTTAAINLVAHSFGELLEAGDQVVVSVAEHHSNLVPWQLLCQRRGLVLRALPVTDDGRIDVVAAAEAVGPRCRLVAVTHCSNVTGAVTDVAPVVVAARAVGARVLLDGAQMAPHGPVDVSALGCDFYAFSGHKVYAPHGVGVLWGRRKLLAEMPPFMAGGGMVGRVEMEHSTFQPPPARFEAGTPPVSGAISLAAAMDWLGGLDLAAAATQVQRLSERMEAGLMAVPGVRTFGPRANAPGRVGIVSFAVDGVHAHDVCQVLDGHGVAVRGGHHCAQPLMAALGVEATVRASLAVYNDDADVDALVAGVAEALAMLR